MVKEIQNFHNRDFNTWLEMDTFMIELQTSKKGDKLKSWSSLNEGIVHMCFLVDNVQKEFERIKKLGYTNFKSKNGQKIYKVEDGFLFKIKASEALGSAISIIMQILVFVIVVILINKKKNQKNGDPELRKMVEKHLSTPEEDEIESIKYFGWKDLHSAIGLGREYNLQVLFKDKSEALITIGKKKKWIEVRDNLQIEISLISL